MIVNKHMSNITFIIFTYNEEKRISYVIKNFIKYGRVCILDGGSTDKTKEITESMGAEFFLRTPSNTPGVENQENFNLVKQIMKNDWIYWGYADNIAPITLVEKMVEISKQDKIKMVKIPLYTYLWGNTSHYALKSHAPFFFHKDYIDFTNNYIHGIGKFLGTKDEMYTLPTKEEYALKHFSTYNITKFVHGHMNYSEREAREKHDKGVRFSILRTFLAMIAYCWIFGRYSYKNGKLGALIVLNYMFYRVMTYTRLYEMENKITIDSIEENYSQKKVEILKQFK
jgi:glycosyltransferase involved in cell wall biosynthesis